MFFLRNLSSSSIARGDPWEGVSIDRVPPECRGKEGKTARSEWATAPLTDHCFYSLFEGTNSAARISGPSATDEGNPPIYCHGFAGDFDFPLTEAEVSAGLARMGSLTPNWRETSLSGNCRLLWLFSRPVPLPSYRFAVAFQESLADILPFENLAGLDRGALKAPERYYANGGIWQRLNPLPVPWALLMGHLVKVSAKFDFKGPDFGVTVPLDAVAEQLKIKYPEFASWPGDFALDSQGPTFWVSGSTSPKSAIVRETGLQTFSNHAHKPFFSWNDLLGAEFVGRFKTEQMGKAVEGIFYDEKHYFSRNSAGFWCVDPKENIIGVLKSERGLTDRKAKGENLSEVERGLVFVQRNHRVKTAAPYAFYPEGTITVLGEKVLNTHTRKTMAPAKEAGEFPFLRRFLDTLFCSPEQLDFFLSWLSYFYCACYRRAPRSGQGIFIAGGTNVGKTFLNRGVIGGLMNGFAEANQFLLGDDTFNSELFDAALWVVDDGSVAADFKSHKRFSEMVKRVAANPSIRCNGKFLKANTVSWQGRIVVTLNTDAESVRMLPDLDLSLREKICIFRTVEEAAVQFLKQDEMEAMLARELPYLARFLLDYQIPPHCLSPDPRFGVRSYLDQSLVDTANQSSVSSTFGEIVEEWSRAHFGEREPHATEWVGTALQLHKAILLDATLTEALKPYNVQSVGRMLVNLAAKKTIPVEVIGDEHRRLFRIRRDEAATPLRRSVIVPQSSAANFQKQ